MKTLRITVEGKTYDVTVEVLEESGAPALPAAQPQAPVAAAPVPAPAAAPAAPPPPAAGAGDVASPLAGTVVSVDVGVGDTVTAGQQVLVLEAMKMNNAVQAPTTGTVKSIAVQAGATVVEGQALLTLG